MRRRFLAINPLVIPAIAITVGILVGDSLACLEWWLGAQFVFLLFSFLLRRHPLLQTLSIALCLFAVGAFGGSMTRQGHENIRWPTKKFLFEGIVMSEVAEKPRSLSFDLIICGQQGAEPVTGRRIKCYMAKGGSSRKLQIGNRLLLEVQVERNREWRQGTFDYRRYMEVRGFSGRAYIGRHDWELLPPSSDGLSALQRLRLRFLVYRHQLLQRYRQTGIDARQYALLAAMTLGERSTMTADERMIFDVSGVSHVLALSGLHLGIVYMLLSLFVVRRWRLLTQSAAVIAIWAFVLLVGMPPSVVRSAVMLTVIAVMTLASRRPPSFNLLSLAAIVILLCSPDTVFDVGFQLSFLAMLGILLVHPRLNRLIPDRFLQCHPLLRYLWGLLTVSIGAQLGTLPLVAYYFGRIAVYGLFTNFIAIPIATIILVLAPIVLAFPAAMPLLSVVVSVFLGVLDFIAANLPYAAIEGLHPQVLDVVLIYVILIVLLLIVDRLWPARRYNR